MDFVAAAVEWHAVFEGGRWACHRGAAGHGLYARDEVRFRAIVMVALSALVIKDAGPIRQCWSMIGRATAAPPAADSTPAARCDSSVHLWSTH